MKFLSILLSKVLGLNDALDAIVFEKEYSKTDDRNDCQQKIWMRMF